MRCQVLRRKMRIAPHHLRILPAPSSCSANNGVPLCTCQHRHSRGPMEASPFAIALTCATSSIFRYAIGSTHCVRHAGAVNGSAKYCVSWDTLSLLNSMMLTV